MVRARVILVLVLKLYWRRQEEEVVVVWVHGVDRAAHLRGSRHLKCEGFHVVSRVDSANDGGRRGGHTGCAVSYGSIR